MEEYAADIYVAAKDIYGNDTELLVKLLEEGLTRTGGNARIKELLIDTYLAIAVEHVKNKRFEDALKIYDRLLELDPENKKMLDGLAECLNLYIEELMEEKKYDEIRALEEKYRGTPGVDFEAILKKIEEIMKPVENQPQVEEPTQVIYTVKFDSDGGSVVAAQSVEAGNTVEQPENPVREGYTFMGWYEDVNTTTKWDFAKEVTGSATIYAKWEKNAAEVKDIPAYAFEWNGHFYACYNNCSSWEDAKKYCESKGGHLATITSADENTAVFRYLLSCGYENAYFGYTDNVEEGSWYWVNNETSEYTNWHGDEPNAESPDEDYAMFYFKFSDGTWNDGNFGNGTINDDTIFICEWD